MSDAAHLSPKHIEQLRKFINSKRTQDFAQTRDARIIFEFPITGLELF
jgi:hypothetical protein